MHGTKGSPNGNWFPWLKEELEQQGHEVYVPCFPTPENQSKENWGRVFDTQAPIFDNDIVLIGHSCGATYLLHILDVVKEPVAHAVLVSSFIDRMGNNEYDELNRTFIEHDFNWNKIKKNAKKITMFHGDNDPYVPLVFAQKIADNLNVVIDVIKDGGHLNAESGYTEFHELLRVL